MGKIEFPMGKPVFPWEKHVAMAKWNGHGPRSGPWANKSNKINTCIFTYLTLYCLLPIKAMYISIKNRH